MAAIDQRRDKTTPGILQEVCTQSDWSLRLSRPGLGALVLIWMVIVTETWVNFALICETIPFFHAPLPKDWTEQSINPARLTPQEWRRSHQACLRAICKIADEVQFDCQVDETGESAHMLMIDDPEAHPITFQSEIEFPRDCHHTLDLMLGSETVTSLGDYLKTQWFQAETIDLIHLYEKPTDTEGQESSSKSKKKALFQILPGQCAVWEIFQQSWYEWYDDAQGDPPPPISLVNWDEVQPGQVVRIRAWDYLCYEHYIPKEDLNYWIKAYEKALEYRWYLSLAAAFVASTLMEFLAMFGAMMRFLPVAICFWKFSVLTQEDEEVEEYKMLRTMIEVWRIWMHLVGIHAMGTVILGSEQVYAICLLATASMLLYGNTKASMEWIFLHILSYGVEYFDADTFSSFGGKDLNYNLLMRSIDDALDIFVPAPGLCFKAIMLYMMYMSSSRLLNRQQ